MEKTLLAVLVVAIAIFVITILVIFVLSSKNKIASLIYKIEMSENSVNENLKKKLELLIRAVNIIERELKIESKKFEEVKKVKSEKLNNIVIDNILNDASKEIIEIKNDYKELSSKKSFNEIVGDIKAIDILLDGGKQFYNKYASVYNNSIKAFPNKLFKYNYKNLYTINSINEDIKIDFTP